MAGQSDYFNNLSYGEKLIWSQCLDILYDNFGFDVGNLIIEYVGNTGNAMHDQIKFFQTIINSVWFRRKWVILLLNKNDLFKLKIPADKDLILFGTYFPDFVKDASKVSEYDQAIGFIRHQFESVDIHHNNRRIFTHIFNR